MATKTETDVLQLERDYREALKKSDFAALQKLTADPCIVVGPQGVVQFKRSQLPSIMDSGEMKLKSYEMDNSSTSIRELRPGVVNIAYKVHEEESDRAGKSWSTDAYNSTLWVKNGNAWECAVHTESVITPPH